MPKEMLYTFIPVTLLCTGAKAQINYFTSPIRDVLS